MNAHLVLLDSVERGLTLRAGAQGFDMRVIAVDPEAVEAPSFVHEVWKMDRFHEHALGIRCCLYLRATDTGDARYV